MSCAHPRITSPRRPTGARSPAPAPAATARWRLWDPGGDQSPHIVKGHRNGVEAVAFALDGRTLASAGEEFAGMEADRPADSRDVSLAVSEARSAPAQGWGSLPGSTRAVQDCYVARTRVIVDNSEGAEAQFVSNLRGALSAAGFEVEVREPSPQAMYDTTVHFVVEGVSVRVPKELGRHDLQIVAAAVRDAEARRNERRRVRAVPIYQGETSRVLAWVDIFASEGL
jgi:hypothetical protein